MKDLLIGAMIIGGAVIAWIAWLFFKALVIAAMKALAMSFLPAEKGMLQWLQDRSMARALGVDVGIIRVRRRIETAAKPIDVPTHEGAKRQC